jgi:hypothetical protein
MRSPQCGNVICAGQEEGTGRAPAYSLPFCLALLPVGVTWPRRLPSTPVVSYTTFSPLRCPIPQHRSARRSLATRFVSVALSASYLARELPGTVPCGVRTFLALHRLPRQAAITRSTQALSFPSLSLPHTALSSTNGRHDAGLIRHLMTSGGARKRARGAPKPSTPRPRETYIRVPSSR